MPVCWPVLTANRMFFAIQVWTSQYAHVYVQVFVLFISYYTLRLTDPPLFHTNSTVAIRTENANRICYMIRYNLVWAAP